MKKIWKINIMMQFMSKGKDQLRSSYEKHIVHPDYWAELLEYLPVDGDDHIRVHLQTRDTDELHITCFYSQENPKRFTEASTYKLNKTLIYL
jgi:hypothetical protein